MQQQIDISLSLSLSSVSVFVSLSLSSPFPRSKINFFKRNIRTYSKPLNSIGKGKNIDHWNKTGIQTQNKQKKKTIIYLCSPDAYKVRHTVGIQ